MSVERYVFKARKLICTTCGAKSEPLLWDYDPLPACVCGGANERDADATNRAPAVIPDGIPGGVLIEHGICNPDGSARRYYSKSSIRAEAAARGLRNHVEHIEGSPHTSRWI